MSGLNPGWMLLALAAGVPPLAGQGVAGAAIEGRVSIRDGPPLGSAIVEVSDPATGARWRAVTRESGRYFLENMPVGGPYRLVVKAVGHAPNARDGITLRLGQRLVLDFALEPVAFQLPPIVASITIPPELNPGRTGPAQTIPDSVIARLAVPQRDFTMLALLSPQVTLSPTGGLSFAGQPDRLNALQIDGATINDLFGSSALAGAGTAGRDRGARTLSAEAVKELQVQSAPFDVRFGNFAGGMVNAVTRSGSNAFHGTVTGFGSGGALVGKDPDGSRGEEFDTREVGLTLGGPIVRDRLAFFVDAGLQRATLPQYVPLIGVDTANGADSAGIGIRRASLDRFIRIMSTSYGVDPGDGTDYPLKVPAGNFFGKLTFQLGVNSRLEFSHNLSHSSPDVLTFDPNFSCRYPGGFCLTASGFMLPITTHATRLQWNTIVGDKITNELLVARLHSASSCEPRTHDFPQIVVAADAGELSAGAAAFCVGEATEERLLELTNNLTAMAGAHRFTAGLHGELIHLPRTNPLDFLLSDLWHFGSLDSLEQGVPDQYSTTFRNPDVSSGPMSDLTVHQFGTYLQDQWAVTPRLTITAGIRLDVPSMSTAPQANSALLDELGLDNTLTPSGHLIWSPRLGVNLGLGSTGSTFLRGGVGVFSGRPAYKWFDAVYSHTGLEALTLECSGDAVPPFVLSLEQQPRSCGPGAAPAVPFASVFDPAFRFPRTLKAALGADGRLPWGMVGTIDVLYTRGLYQFFVTDVNLERSVAPAFGEGGRAMYGTVDTSGHALPSRVSDAFGPVLRMTNTEGDQAVSLSGQLQKRVGDGAGWSLAYTFTSARDRFSAQEDGPDDDLGQVPIDGSLDDRQLAASVWNVPHKLTFVGTVNLPAGFKAAIFYTGLSGTGYTYVVDGDANADGIGEAFTGRFNDIVYVPARASEGGDIALVVPGVDGGFVPAPGAEYERLEAIIGGEPCLAASRGHHASRNACRNPWSNHTSARLSKRFATGGSRSIEVMADVFNLFGLLHREWGEVHRAGGGGDVPLLRLVGYDPPAGRGIYQVLPVDRDAVDAADSRWRVQLGVRYVF